MSVEAAVTPALLVDANVRERVLEFCLAADLQPQTTVGEDVDEGATIGARYGWDRGHTADGVVCSEPSHPLFRLGRRPETRAPSPMGGKTS
jgi:hypothetical protein